MGNKNLLPSAHRDAAEDLLIKSTRGLFKDNCEDIIDTSVEVLRKVTNQFFYGDINYFENINEDLSNQFKIHCKKVFRKGPQCSNYLVVFTLNSVSDTFEVKKIKLYALVTVPLSSAYGEYVYASIVTSEFLNKRYWCYFEPLDEDLLKLNEEGK